MLINNSITEEENIVALLNEVFTARSRGTVEASALTISNPTVLNADIGSNTKVTIRNKSASNAVLTNPVNLTYTRLSLPEILKRKNQSLSGEPVIALQADDWDTYNEEAMKSDLINKLKLAESGVNIEVTMDASNKTATITPKRGENSLLYVGSITLTITKE